MFRSSQSRPMSALPAVDLQEEAPEVIKMCFISSFVQPEGAASDLGIINKKSYKTTRGFHTCASSRGEDEEDKQQQNKQHLRLPAYNFAY